MAIPTVSRDYDTIFTTTWDERRKELVDNIYLKHPLFEKLVKNRVSGSGLRIQLPLKYNKSTTGKYLVTDMDTLTPSQKEVATMAEDQWREYADSLAISMVNLKKNSGANRFFNFLNVQIDSLFDSVEEAIQKSWWAATPAATDSNSIPSLFSTAGTGTVHTINSTVETWWGNQSKASVGSFATFGRDRMKQLWNLTNQTKQKSLVDLIFTDQTGYENFETILEARERVDIDSKTQTGNLGFGGLSWKGATINWDPFLATANGGPSTSTDGRWYFLNSDFLHLYVCDGTWMEESELLESYDQLAYGKKLWSMFNLMTSNRRKFGVMSGVTYP